MRWIGPDGAVEHLDRAEADALPPAPPPPPAKHELGFALAQVRAARATLGRVLHGMGDDMRVVHPQAPLDLVECRTLLHEVEQLVERIGQELAR